MTRSKPPPRKRARKKAAKKAPAKPKIPKGRQQCAAITAKAARCRRLAAEGADHCAVHLGAPVGRKVKFDEEAAKRILEVLKVGGYVETAAAAAGIAKQTFYNWMERGDPDGTHKDDEPFRMFRDDVELARAEGESRAVVLIARAAAKDWKAAAWMLERQYPDRWAGPRGRSLQATTLTEEPSLEGDGNNAGGWVDDQVGPDGKSL